MGVNKILSVFNNLGPIISQCLSTYHAQCARAAMHNCNSDVAMRRNG